MLCKMWCFLLSDKWHSKPLKVDIVMRVMLSPPWKVVGLLYNKNAYQCHWSRQMLASMVDVHNRAHWLFARHLPLWCLYKPLQRSTDLWSAQNQTLCILLFSFFCSIWRPAPLQRLRMSLSPLPGSHQREDHQQIPPQTQGGCQPLAPQTCVQCWACADSRQLPDNTPHDQAGRLVRCKSPCRRFWDPLAMEAGNLFVLRSERLIILRPWGDNRKTCASMIQRNLRFHTETTQHEWPFGRSTCYTSINRLHGLT